MEIPKIETRIEVKNQDNKDTAELYLYGVIRKACWWDDEEDVISAKRVRKSLKELKGKNINVHINSGGGDVFESIAICNSLKQHDGKIKIVVDALAGSGASVIAMAGDEVEMFNNAMIMIHKAWTYTSGNSDDLEKVANDLKKIDTSVKASYKEKFVGTDEELNDLIKAESWLTAEECVAFGFCNKIIENSTEDEEETTKNNIKQTLFNKYNKTINAEVGEKKPTLFNSINKTKMERGNI